MLAPIYYFLRAMELILIDEIARHNDVAFLYLAGFYASKPKAMTGRCIV
jgi:hypothetical protein